MCKKFGVTVLVLVAGLFVLHKLDLLGYIKTYVARCKEEIHGSIKAETKLRRIKDELRGLDGPINEQKTVVAREQAQIEVLDREIADTKADLKEREKKLALLRENLKNASGEFVIFQEQKVPKAKVEATFTRKFQEYEAAEATLKAKEELRATRQERVELGVQHLATMKSKQRQMKARLEKLELELAKVRDAQMQHDVAVNDSQFADIMKRLDDVELQVTTDRKLVSSKIEDDADAVVEKGLEQQAQTKNALEKWDARAGKPDGDAKVTRKDKD